MEEKDNIKNFNFLMLVGIWILTALGFFMAGIYDDSDKIITFVILIVCLCSFSFLLIWYILVSKNHDV